MSGRSAWAAVLRRSFCTAGGAAGGDAAPVPGFLPRCLRSSPRVGRDLLRPGPARPAGLDSALGWRTVFPGRPRRFGYPYFAPRGAYRRFSAVPVVWRVQEDCGAVRPPRTAPWLFPRPVRSVPPVPPRRSFLGPSRDGPVSLPEARSGVLPPSRWIGASGRLWGGQVCTEGSRGCVSPGLSPAGGAFLGPFRDGPVSPPEARAGVLPPSRYLARPGGLRGRQAFTAAAARGRRGPFSSLLSPRFFAPLYK